MPKMAKLRSLGKPGGLAKVPGSMGVAAIAATLVFTVNSHVSAGAAEYVELPAIQAITDFSGGVLPDGEAALALEHRLGSVSRTYTRTEIPNLFSEFPEAFANGELQPVVATPAPIWCTFTGLTHLPETHELCSPHGNNTPEQNRALGEFLTAQRGWEGEQWQCMDNLMMRESRWRHNAANPVTAARGIPQKMMSVHYGANWRTSETAAAWMADPEAQIEWGLNYIERRYQSPCGAWNFFLRNGWY